MVLVTSTGFHGSYLRSSQGISMTAISGDGTGMERDYDFSSAPHAADLASPESVGRKAGERTVARANPRKVETCKVPVVFDPRVSGSLVGHLIGAVNGASIARKTSFLKDRIGQQLFARNIRIIDDPLRVRGLRSQPFDAEGVTVKKLAIIDEGVLTSWLLDSATARELGLVTTGHAHRGVSSSPSPGAYNLHMKAGKRDAGRADRRHQAGLLRHRPDRLRRQRRDRRLQPRRVRLLDRERRDQLSRQRGDDRRPFARHLQVADAGQRSGIPLRRQCADGAHRGTDGWRTLIRSRDQGERCGAADGTVREAGALALSMFRTELKNWTKGASSPVSEADIAVNDLIESRLRSATPDYGWLSEESADDEARLGKKLVWIVDPIDGTRAYLAGREDWCVSVALVEDATPVLAAVFAPATDEFFFAMRGQGATRNASACSRPRAPISIFPAWPAPSRWCSGSARHRMKSRCIRASVRWRCGCAGSRRAVSMPPSPAATAATGTLRRRI